MSVRLLQATSRSVAYGYIMAVRRTVILQNNLAMSSAAPASSPDDDVLISQVGDKGILTMNRPKVLNALSISMIRKMTTQLKKWQAESAVKFVIIKGAGGKAFCCGGDLREVTDAGRVLGEISRQFFFEEYTLDYMTGHLGVPWVALIDGVTMGAGFGLSVHGHYRVATEKTLFAMPETAIGLFPDVGGGHFLPRLPGKLGLYFALTGARLRGRDVHRLGVATHFVDSTELANLEKDLLSLNSPKPSDVEHVLQTYHDKCTLDRDTPFVIEPYIDKINSLFAGETLEKIYDNLKQDGSEWALSQLDTLNKMSPTSMKVTMRQFEEGADVSLAKELKTEYRLSQRFVRDKDLYEGVRAIIVDKDQNPAWAPARIEDVTKEKVDWYFSPLPEDLPELVLPE